MAIALAHVHAPRGDHAALVRGQDALVLEQVLHHIPAAVARRGGGRGRSVLAIDVHEAASASLLRSVAGLRWPARTLLLPTGFPPHPHPPLQRTS